MTTETLTGTDISAALGKARAQETMEALVDRWGRSADPAKLRRYRKRLYAAMEACRADGHYVLCEEHARQVRE